MPPRFLIGAGTLYPTSRGGETKGDDPDDLQPKRLKGHIIKIFLGTRHTHTPYKL